MRNLKVAVAVLIAVAFCALVWGASSPARAAAAGGTSAAVHQSSGPSASSRMVLTRRIGGVTVLTNARGFTLYSFGPDTATTSKCNGTCARLWPPLTAPVSAGPGVTGKIGRIRRSDGSAQATYDGHPLYTYVGDLKPGEDNGNNLNVQGGVWHVVPVSGGR